MQYENLALQAQNGVYQAELKKCQDTITHLKTRYVSHARYPGKDNIIIIVRKHTTSAKDMFHDHEVIVEIDNPNNIQTFNRFEEERHAERRYNHFKLIDLTREELYAWEYLSSLMRRRKKKNKKIFSARGSC